ncbi:Lrp/AsnC family transcriptional regulator [Noviherbaspirillum saxi]|nr:Lrp/AsnC family transcriptional regulator [Noviherbaspirillum saxi]
MSNQKNKTRPLDELDEAILSLLRIEPLESNKTLAQKLTVSEAAIAARLRALERDGIMKVMAQCDYRAMGYDLVASVEIAVVGRKSDAVDEFSYLYLNGAGSEAEFRL